MPLPFTQEAFFDVFAAYNAALWPAWLALWLASVVTAVFVWQRRLPGRWVSAVLGVHWVWSAIAYHALFFTRINVAAWVFAALFLAQAALFVRVGVVHGRLSFSREHPVWTPMAWLLVAYSLLYPAINALLHWTLSRIPTFGVPCPTTLFTIGLLLLATPQSGRLSIVPVTWAILASSAAFQLEVTADYALPIAAAALVLSILTRRRRDFASRAAASPA
jgi:hypothetical protein